MNRVGLVLSVCCLSFSPAAIADNLHPEQTPRKAGDTVVDRTGKPMVLIPAGQFTMGDKHDHDRDARGAHKVRITRAFYMDKYEVTRGDFAACVKAGVCFWPLGERTRPITPTGSTQRENWGLKYCGPKMFRAPADHPLTCVDYNEARYYCEAWRGGRLPTEAEWEYACRAGSTAPRYGDLDAVAWHRGNSGGWTHPVGHKQANAWGLHDMLGNVWEWTGDRFGTYPGGRVTDPVGSTEGTPRVTRGGSWWMVGRCVRAAHRSKSAPSYNNDNLGFRVARSIR